MAHFAELDENNIVQQVIVVHNNELIDENGVEQEAIGAKFCQDLLSGRWIKTSYNATINGFRKNFAGVGYTYDETRDAFISPKPYASWLLNEQTCIWEPPIAYPNDDNYYEWNEDTVLWELFNPDHTKISNGD